jgi:hypothetical protein
MPSPTENKAIVIMMSLLTTGFLAWAGVVWTASQDAITYMREVHQDVSVIRERVERLATDMSEQRRELREHQAIPIHHGAAVQFERLKAEVEAMREHGQ